MEIINSGQGYNKYDPQIILNNHPDDQKGFGALMKLNIKDGIINKIYAETNEDRGYNYQFPPKMSIYGSRIFIAEITEFDDNGGLKKIVVRDSIKWPSQISPIKLVRTWSCKT